MNKIKQAPITLQEYLNINKSLSPMNAFAFKKSYVREVNRTYDEWVKFFQDK